MWKIWFAIIGLLVILRITILNDSSADMRSTIFKVYSISTWITLIFIFYINGKRLRTYLHTDHINIYNKIYSRAYGTDIVVNPIAGIKFIFSKERHDDTNLNMLINENRKLLLLILTVFITLPILSIMMN